MTFAATRIITDDVDNLVLFYENVLDVTAKRLHPLFSEIETDKGVLDIASSKTIPLLDEGYLQPHNNRSVIFDFLVEDVDSAFIELQNKGIKTFVNEPTNMPWGNRSLLFKDPDGNLINFFKPIDKIQE